jgi:nucleoside-diphosphate-sugar epimerase
VAHDETFLITGANGFIGGWLAESLFLSDSANVRAGIRTWSGAARLARFPHQLTLCDVMNPEQAAQATEGVTCVIHCVSGSSEIITQGTRNMLEAARQQGVRRFVYFSTAEVYGNPSGEVTEASACQRTGNPYGDSKIEAEELCWEYQGRGLPVTIIRPPIVYGPFSRDWTANLALKLLSGQWGVFKGYGEGACNLIYVTDLVAGVLLAARHEAAAGQAFNLNGPEPLTWNDYFRRFNAALGLPDLQVVERGGARARAAAMEPVRYVARFVRDHFEGPVKDFGSRYPPAGRLMKYLERSLKTTPRITDLSLYNRDARYLTTKARDLLGFEPRCDVDLGLRMSVLWLEHVGLRARPLELLAETDGLSGMNRRGSQTS